MKLLLQDAQGTREVECQIESDMVLQGGQSYPGVTTEDDSFIAECSTYAINEGGVLCDVWDLEGEEKMAFVVSSVTRSELESIRRLDAKPPKGAVIVTEDGYKFTVSEDGTITDGDMSFTSLAEIDADFVLTATL